MALEPKTQAELAAAGARFVSATGGRSPLDQSPLPGPSGNGRLPTIEPRSTETLIAWLEDGKLRSNNNWAALIAAIHRFSSAQAELQNETDRQLGTK